MLKTNKMNNEETPIFLQDTIEQDREAPVDRVDPNVRLGENLLLIQPEVVEGVLDTLSVDGEGKKNHFFLPFQRVAASSIEGINIGNMIQFLDIKTPLTETIIDDILYYAFRKGSVLAVRLNNEIE